VNDKEFRQHLAELLARQRNPDLPAKKNRPTPEPAPKPATMSNKEFRQHLKQLMARQRNEEQPPVEKKPPTISRISKPPVPEPRARKPPASVNTTRTFNVRRKSK
jgi:hypothetical protein